MRGHGLVDEAALVARPQKWYALRVPQSSCLLPQAVAARSRDSGCLWGSTYRVVRDDCYYIVKDVWICRKRKPTELYFYLRARSKGVRHIPTLLDFWNVVINDRLDTCEVGTGDDELIDRIHRRYIFKECGVPIWEFRSLRELINAFIDYIEGKTNLILAIA